MDALRLLEPPKRGRADPPTPTAPPLAARQVEEATEIADDLFVDVAPNNIPKIRQRFDATKLTDAEVESAIAKSIRRKSGATGNAAGEIVATPDQVEFMLEKMTRWRRDVHAGVPELADLPSDVKGTLLHSSVAKRMRNLDIEGLHVNERLYGTAPSRHISPVAKQPYTFRIPDYRIQKSILDIKPRGTPLSGPQVDDFKTFGKTSDVSFIYYDPY